MVRRLLALAACLIPLVLGARQQTVPLAEQVYTDIRVFKGVPASDIIPAMEFMNASLGYKCTDCHNPTDYSEDSEKKAISRRMVAMQREINEKWFKGKLETTCYTCHNGKGHPDGTPIPAGITLRHPPASNPPSVDALIAKHLRTAGAASGAIARVGTLTAPNDLTHKPETLALEYLQAPGGKYRIQTESKLIISDGLKVTYGGLPLDGEPAAIFNRMGRAWRSKTDFAGLEKLAVAGKEKLGGMSVYVVRGSRPASLSTEELYFDATTGLLVRLVNIRRSTIGTVIGSIDYRDYKKVGSVMLPMSVVGTFADGTKWTMSFKTAKISPTVDASKFKPF